MKNIILAVAVLLISCNSTSTNPLNKESKKDTKPEQGIVGKWVVLGSDGDVVQEFTASGEYIYTQEYKNQIMRGTYSYDEKQNILDLNFTTSSGEKVQSRREVKIEGDRMQWKMNDDLGWQTYKRL